METEKPNVCYIKNEFFEKFREHDRLMQNHDDVYAKRPHYFVRDTKSRDIYWCVPMSSQTAKFDAEIKKERAKRQEQGETADCFKIVKGEYGGKPTCFLLQNMFPVTKKYIEAYGHTISAPLKSVIDRNISLTLKGQSFCFIKIGSIKRVLIEELTGRKKHSMNEKGYKSQYAPRRQEAQNNAKTETKSAEQFTAYTPTPPTQKSKCENVSGMLQYVQERQKKSVNQNEKTQDEKTQDEKTQDEKTQEATSDAKEEVVVQYSKEEWDEKLKSLMPEKEEEETSIEAHRKQIGKTAITK